jgi:hypothetical protein
VATGDAQVEVAELALDPPGSGKGVTVDLIVAGSFLAGEVGVNTAVCWESLWSLLEMGS